MRLMSRQNRLALLRAAVFLIPFLLGACDMRPSAGHYQNYTVALRAMGDLRVDTAPADAPYDAEDLVTNFERIALHHEADASRAGGEDNWAPNPLMRWAGPLRYHLFGNAVTDEDRSQVRRLMTRIAGLTGLDISDVGTEVNFIILITKPDERKEFAAELSGMHPALADTFKFWRRTPGVVCVANNLYSANDRNHITVALVAIGSETTGLLRQACLHEEIVQALGLANDHPKVRPSIFNDDGEFALLTEHDEHLLRLLYDPRLESGMTAAQAMPVVRQIVAELALAPRSNAIGTMLAAQRDQASEAQSAQQLAKP